MAPAAANVLAALRAYPGSYFVCHLSSISNFYYLRSKTRGHETVGVVVVMVFCAFHDFGAKEDSTWNSGD